MNRLKKELLKRGLVGDNEIDVITGKSNIEWESKFVTITDKFIITTNYTNVLDSMFRIYDFNFNLIATQCILYDNMEHWNFGNFNPWDVTVF